MLDHHRGIRVQGGAVQEIDEAIVAEERFSLEFNGRSVGDMIASRNQLRELGAGYLITEGLASCIGAVDIDGNRILVSAEACCELSRQKKEIGSSGGESYQRPFSRVTSGIRIAPEEVIAITREIETDIWRKTGAVHCSVLYHKGTCIVKSSDVGRHNTVDKVVGYAVLNGIDLSQCVIGCTGRQPAGMVKKHANAGIPIVISRAASTDRGIAVAEESGITLVCFSRGDRFTVYTHPERITGLAGSGAMVK